MEAGRASVSTTIVIATGRDKSNQAAGYGDKPQRIATKARLDLPSLGSLEMTRTLDVYEELN